MNNHKLKLVNKDILWVNYAASTPDESGPSRHFEIAKRLGKIEGVRCRVVTSSIHHSTQTNRIEGEDAFVEKVVSGVPFVYVNSRSSSRSIFSRFWAMVSFSLRLYKVLTSKSLKADLIVGSSPHLPQALICYFAAKRRGVPFILEVRDIWPDSLIEIGGYSSFHPGVLILRCIEQFLYKRSDAIVAVLPGFRDHLESKGIRDKTVIDLPNCASLSSLEVSDRNLGETFEFIYTGAHGLAQNLMSIVEAAEILQKRGDSNISITLVGSGFEKESLVREAKEKGLQNIRFLPPVSKAEVGGLIGSADAAILHLRDIPLFEKGISPNKLFDYMQLSKPILFATRAPFREIDEMQCGLRAEPDNPEDIADKMVEFASLSSDQLEELGKGAKKLVDTRYNYDISVAQFSEKLADILV